MMNAQEIIQYIATAEKKTPVKITLREKNPAEPHYIFTEIGVGYRMKE